MLMRSNNVISHVHPILWSATTLLFVFVTMAARAGVNLDTAEAEAPADGGGAEAKAIRVDSPETEPLRVVLEPTKNAFVVDEPIRFRMRGNKEFFFYLFSIDNETERATLILPSKEGQRENKYPANRTLPVPNRGEPDFLSDTPGRETLVMVASTRYLPIKSNWFRDGADSFVDQAEFEEEFAEKGIRVGGDPTSDGKVHVRKLTVRVREKDRVGAGGGNDRVWLTTKGNRTEYALGDRIEAVFGAGDDGWVQMYVIEPSGDRMRLKSVPVKADRAYTMNAIAADPAGKHAFVAFFSKDEPGEGAMGHGRDKSLLDAAPKGVRLVDDPSSMMAVYRFRITD